MTTPMSILSFCREKSFVFKVLNFTETFPRIKMKRFKEYRNAFNVIWEFFFVIQKIVELLSDDDELNLEFSVIKTKRERKCVSIMWCDGRNGIRRIKKTEIQNPFKFITKLESVFILIKFLIVCEIAGIECLFLEIQVLEKNKIANDVGERSWSLFSKKEFAISWFT